MKTNHLILQALRHPERLVDFDLPQWDALLKQARLTDTPARLAARIERAGIEDQLPTKVQDHLVAARAIVDQHRRISKWEVNRICRALMGSGIHVVLLKGAAYILADLPPGFGRLVSDVDIMVPKDDIFRAEDLLKAAGWKSMKLDAYDQRYYRQWMHELPPMQHRDRKAVLDVHHTILPESGRVKPDASKLFAASRTIIESENGKPAVTVLSPADMVLHSAAHLFQDGDLAGGLRDIADLDELMRHFGEHEPDFWETLVPRSKEMDLHRSLYYALRFCKRLLDTPVSAATLAASREIGKPLWPAAPMMDFFANRALLPEHLGNEYWGSGTARWMLYVRSHWLRMPPWLLTQHLTRKALRRWFKSDDEKKSAA